MPLRAGDLKHYITIESVAEVVSAGGGVSETWSTFANAYADIRPLSSREYIEGTGDQADITHRVYLRALPGLKAKMRFTFDSRTFEIMGPPLEAREAGDLMTLMCREVNP